ncbi:MAG TPA: hypothetical protein VGJ92_04890 [Methanocella sp.]
MQIKKTYVEFLYPGIIVSEKSAREVHPDVRDHPEMVHAPDGCIGFRFYDRIEIPIEGVAVETTAKTIPINESGWYYFGQELTTEQVMQLEGKEYDILKANLKYSDIRRVVISDRYGTYVLGIFDKVIPRRGA